MTVAPSPFFDCSQVGRATTAAEVDEAADLLIAAARRLAAQRRAEEKC